MSVKIQFRRDTLTNWTTQDPVISAGEMALNTDDNTFKLGNGSTQWTLLPTVSGPAGNAIDRIELSSSSGLVDTYTIYYTDLTSTFFTVTNGVSGDVEAPTITGFSMNVASYQALDTGLMTQDETITFSNIPATGTIVFLVDLQTGGFTPTWTAAGYTFSWDGDSVTEPTYGTRDLIVFTRTEGTTVLKAVQSWTVA